MFKASLRSVLGHLPRFLLSSLAVVLGIAFMVGSLTFTGMLKQSIKQLTTSAIPDIAISRKGTYESDTTVSFSSQQMLQESDFAPVSRVDGVVSIDGVLSNPGVYPLNAEGRVASASQAPGLGFSWMTAPAYGGQPGIVVVEGHEPTSSQEVAVDPQTYRKLGVSLGEQIRIATPQETITRTLVGTATFGNSSGVGASYTFFTTEDAQRVLLGEGITGFQMGWVTLDENRRDEDSRRQIVDEINKVLPEGWEATDGGKVAEFNSSYIDKSLSFVNTFLLVFAGIGLVVAIFLIVNTFSILVAQRGRELALLRALGASRGQVSRSVLFESLVIGLIGSAGGLGLGCLLAWGISWAMSQSGVDMSTASPVPSLSTVIAALVVGILVTVASAWFPAQRGSRIPPVVAMTGQLDNDRPRFGRKEIMFIGLGLMGLGSMLAGTLWLDEDGAFLVGLGAVLLLISMTTTGAIIGTPLLWLLGGLWRLVFRTPGKLASLNTKRHPRRTASTATALVVGLTLVSTISILGSSTIASVRSLAGDMMHEDFRITPASAFTGMPGSLVDRFAEIDGVKTVIAQRTLYTVDAEKKSVTITGVDPQFLGATLTMTIVDGQEYTDNEGEAIISRKYADSHSLKVGDIHEVTSPATVAAYGLRIVGIFEVPEGMQSPSVMTGMTTMTALGASGSLSTVGITLTEDADRDAVKQQLTDALADQPMLKVEDRDEFVDSQTSTINTTLNTIYALLGLAIVIAILGIVNTLVLSTIERTRELGLLRAVGMQRSQLRRMIALESITIALLGAVLGVGLGLSVGICLQHVLVNQGLRVLAINWTLVAVCMGGAVLVGVLAAVSPARRAARMNILDAIAHE
ncbi:hypothetical protein HMPREF1531_00888 [Propionibacterium sp. oral taxon 192 str. F0372]|uniref:ABC transporter permease n=1 Tax=Propionibacterium sp. oral taxon 192 TaxID=671222 RepID=UPI000352EC58|nr:ABC transporter permease [Propionibacterium sp. oral taxon 192]EPH06239.1 hypothetical protein HMPREF1531_00888 [Propionibacterium sp. oral taxon 192 str. F0372]